MPYVEVVALVIVCSTVWAIVFGMVVGYLLRGILDKRKD